MELWGIRNTIFEKKNALDGSDRLGTEKDEISEFEAQMETERAHVTCKTTSGNLTCLLAVAAITNYHKFMAQNNTNVLPYSFEDCKLWHSCVRGLFPSWGSREGSSSSFRRAPAFLACGRPHPPAKPAQGVRSSHCIALTFSFTVKSPCDYTGPPR